MTASGEKTRPANGFLLSVIVIVRHPQDTPDAVLTSLAAEMGAADEPDRTEVILVDGRPDAPQPSCALPDPFTRLNRPNLNMPLLKAQGVLAARGRYLAFLEPKAVPMSGWLRAGLDAIIAHPEAAIGGAVVSGATRAVDRAVYRFEYAAFSQEAVQNGKGTDLPGNNMILPAAELDANCADILNMEGLNKPFCQARLTAAGVAIKLVPQMAVRLETGYRFWPLLSSRFQYARCFGGTRVIHTSRRMRWLYRLGAPVIPVLLVRRHVGAALRAQGSERLGGSGLAALFALCLTWSAGETAGYWFGSGMSCDNLY